MFNRICSDRAKSPSPDGLEESRLVLNAQEGPSLSLIEIPAKIRGASHFSPRVLEQPAKPFSELSVWSRFKKTQQQQTSFEFLNADIAHPIREQKEAT